MSENIEQVPVTAPEAPTTPLKPKQYLLMADESNMVFLSKLMPTMLFVEVEGMSMKDNADFMLLVNPVPKKPEEVPQEQSLA